MLTILSRNNAYHNDAVKLYELAKVYLPQEDRTLPDEPKHLLLGTYGEGEDFFSLKGEIEAIFRGMNVRPARLRYANQPSCLESTLSRTAASRMEKPSPMIQ